MAELRKEKRDYLAEKSNSLQDRLLDRQSEL